MHSNAGVRTAIPRDSATSERRAYTHVTPTVIEPIPYEIEGIRSDLGEISKFVNGRPTATRRVNTRRCYKTSVSSGYSSQSPLLSVGSCSYYASTRDPSYGGLAVIHESETACVPRPIWPFVACHPAENNIDYEGIYTCRVCGCTCSCYSSPSSPHGTSAREVLLELSRTLNSVINGDVSATPEDILRDISRIVSVEIGPRSDNLYECVCSSWTLNDDNNPSVSPSPKDVPPKSINSINSESHVAHPRAFNENNSRSALLFKNDKLTKRENAEIRKSCETSNGPYILEYFDGRCIENDRSKLSFGLDEDCKRCQNGPVVSTELKYSTQLDYSDAGSSSEETIASSNDWNRRLAVKNSGKDFDFTLDVTRAERLTRTIVKAKRKRQWCRTFTALFGFIFFVLSVIVVSLYITRGRKVFGSI